MKKTPKAKTKFHLGRIENRMNKVVRGKKGVSFPRFGAVRIKKI